jgi:streptomycin 6-kinase
VTAIAGVPTIVRNKALAVGAAGWLASLPDLVASIERDWSITVGQPYDGGTEAFVAQATLADGSPAVLKLVIPRGTDDARNEITVLRRTEGAGCAALLRSDVHRGALLLERLGRSMAELNLPIRQRQDILCAAAAAVWRHAPGCGLPTGADKGRWLTAFILRTWEELNRPCQERTIEHGLACAARRIEAHDDEHAVLVHGDVHQWNALEATDGFKLVDPDGLLAAAEYDLGILMREDPDELLGGDARGRSWDRARYLAGRAGLEPVAIWEWGVVERVSTGLLCTSIGLQPVGRQMLAVADRLAQ